MPNNDVKTNDLQDMMQIMIENQDKFEENQNKLIAGFVRLEDKVEGNTEKINKIEKDLEIVKNIVEKDTKKQADHEVEHIVNITAHDRFEQRIVKVESKVGMATAGV